MSWGIGESTLGRWRLRSAFGCVLAVWLALGASSPAKADTSVIAARQAVNSALFVAGAVAVTTSSDGPLNLALNRVLQQMYELSPSLPPGTATNDIQALAAAYHAHAPSTEVLSVETPNQQIIGALRIVDENTPPTVSTVTVAALQAVAQAALEATADSALKGAVFTPSAASMKTLETGLLAPRQVFADAHQLAGMNGSFAQAWNSLWSAATHEGITMTTRQLLTGNPALQGADVRQVTSKLAPDGSMISSVSALATLTQPAFGQLHSITQAAATPGESTQQASTNAQEIHDAQAGLSLLASLIRLGDASGANAVESMAGTMTDVATLFNNWSVGNKTGQILSGIASVATAALTGNVIGVVSSLSNLFGGLIGGSGPSAQQILSQQVSALTADLNHFEQITVDRFNQLDAALVGIYQKLTGDLQSLQNSINNDFAHIEADFTTVYADFRRLQVQLDQLQQNLYQLVKDAQNRDLWGDPNAGINTVLGFQQGNATGQQMLNAQFQGADGFLFQWATSSAHDSVALGPTLASSDFQAANVLPRLNYGLESNLDYLNLYPSLALSPALPTLVPGSNLGQSPPPLPNPAEWAVAGQAYAELLLENPNYVTATQSGSSGRLQQIEQQGDGTSAPSLRCALANVGNGLSVCGSNNRPQGTTLFTGLGNNYLKWGATDSHSVEGEIKTVEGQFLAAHTTTSGVQSLGGPANLQAAGLNLWSGADQSANWSANTSSANGCGSGAVTLPSNGLAGTDVPAVYDHALELGNGTGLSVSCSATLTNVRYTVKCIKGNCVDQYYADNSIAFNWSMSVPSGPPMSNIAGVTVVTPANEGHSMCSVPDGDPACISDGQDNGDEVNFQWSYYQPIVQHSGTLYADSSAKSSEDSVVSGGLVTLQKSLYGQIVNGGQADGGLTMPNSPLGQAVTSLQGAAGAIAAYVQAGLGPALLNDDTLRSLILSSSHLMNSGSLASAITTMYNQASSNPPATDELGAVDAQLRADESALEDEIAKVLADTGFDETNPLVQTTLDRLHLTDDVLRWFHPGASGPATVGTISGTILDNEAAPPGGPGPQPLAGICVQARTPGTTTVVDSAITDAHGSYTLFGLPVPSATAYNVYMYDCTNGYALPQYYGGGTNPSTAQTVTVSPGAITALINQLAAQLTVGGRITGTVMTAAPTPVAIQGACVAAINGSTTVAQARTAADGTYTLASVPVGSYKVRFSDCGHGTYSTQYYNHVTTPSAATSVTVGAAAVASGIAANLSSTVTATVNSTGDGSWDGKTPKCETGAGNGVCTLRAAIQLANTVPGAAIHFNIAGGGVKVIAPASALPKVTAQTVIDGSTQPGYRTGSPTAELSGSGAGAVTGLTLASSAIGSTIKGLDLVNWRQSGIELDSSHNTVTANLIGLLPSGAAPAQKAQAGVLVSGGSSNTIGGLSTGSGNAIAFNGTGVRIDRSAGNTVLGDSIFSNGATGTGPGIVLTNGANGGQAAPTITNVSTSGSTTAITGTAGGNFSGRIEVFSNPSCGDPEGRQLLADARVTTTTTSPTWRVTVPAVATGKGITATATTAGTSPFSACVAA